MTEGKNQSFYQGVRACIPTVLGYLGIGIAAGVVEKGVGMTLLQIALVSIIVYAGSAQFIICGLIAIQAPPSTIIATVFLVNLRHFLMSMSVAPYFRDYSLLNTIGLGTLLTDESYGVLVTELKREQAVSANWTHGLNVTAYLTWILANLLGGVVGHFIPDPTKFGLDFALTAMFLGLFLFQADLPLKKKTRQTLLLLFIVVVSLFLLMRVTSPEVAVIFATLIGCGVGVATHES